MAGQSGRNYGTTGIIDLDSPTLPPIQAEIVGLALALLADVIDVTGPASAYARKVYGGNVGGSGSASGKVQSKRRPFPPTLHNLQGTLTSQQDTGCTIAFPILIESLTCTKNQKTSDTWMVEIKWRKSGAETIVWPGGEYSYTQPILATLELFETTSKLTDPNALITAYSVKYFLPIPAVVSPAAASYTDTAGNAAVDAWIAAAVPPRALLKVHDTTLLRIDDGAGMLIVNWALKDTVDEQEIPVTYTITDPNNLTSEASVGLVDSTPSTPAGFVERTIKTQEVVPGRPLNVITAGLRTTKEDVEFPDTKTDVDPTDLNTEGKKVTVHATASPPSDPSPPTHTKIVGKWTIQLTSAGTPQSETVWEFAQQSSKDKIEQGESITSTDALGLETRAKLTKVNATPSTPSGMVVRITNSRDLNDWNSATSVEYGLRTTVEDVEFPDTFTNIDANSIETNGKKTTVHTTGSVPSDPTPPAGTKIVMRVTYKLTSATSKSKTIWSFDVMDSVDKIVVPRTITIEDPNELEDKAIVAAVFDNGSPPADPSSPISGLKIVNRKDTGVTPTKSVREVEFGRNDSKDDIERSLRHGTTLTVDANGQDSEGRITIVNATQPATPSAPDATVKFVNVTSRPTTDALSTYIFNFGVEDSKDRLEKSEVSTDPDGLENAAKISVFDGSPSAPVSPAGLVLVESTDKALPNGHVLTTGAYGMRTNKQTIQFNGSEVSIGLAFSANNSERITTVETCLITDTLEDLAQAKYATVTGTTSPTQGVPFAYLRARRYHDTAVIFTVVYEPQRFGSLPPTDKIRISGSITPIVARTWLGLDDSGNPSVNVVRCQSRGTGKYLIQLAQFEAQGIGGPLRIQQRITGATPPLGTSSILKVNNAPFLGFPTGTVMYCGAAYDIVISDTSSTYDMVYFFNLQINQQFDDDGTVRRAAFPTITGIPPGGAILADSAEAVDFVNGTGGPPTYVWSNLGLRANLPSTDAFSFTTWVQ